MDWLYPLRTSRSAAGQSPRATRPGSSRHQPRGQESRTRRRRVPTPCDWDVQRGGTENESSRRSRPFTSPASVNRTDRLEAQIGHLLSRRCGSEPQTAGSIDNERCCRAFQAAGSARRCGSQPTLEPILARLGRAERRFPGKRRSAVSVASRSRGGLDSARPADASVSEAGASVSPCGVRSSGRGA